MRVLLKICIISTVCWLLVGCASKNGSNGTLPGQTGAAAKSKAYAMAPTPVFAGAPTTIGGDNQTYYFDYDSSSIDSAELASIRAQADYLIAHPQSRVRLEGNTDNRGSREYNVALGLRRSQSVRDIMLQKYGVAPQQIVMLSYGKERPAVAGDTEAAWSKNRRVNLIYEAK